LRSWLLSSVIGDPHHRLLEPVLTQHRLVAAESFLREDAATEDRDYPFLCQLTYLTRERGALVKMTGSTP
jgi:hypothetical protein